METPTLDGPAISPDSAELNPPPPADPAEVTRSEDGRTVKGPDKSMLKALGMSSATAKRFLAQGQSTKYLNTKIVAQVSLVTQATNSEELLKAQHTANKIARDPTVDARSRAACITAVGQCGMALARASEVAMSLARNLDNPEAEEPQPEIRLVQNNNYGFPPVVKTSRRRTATSAKDGDDGIVDVTPAAKPE